MEKTFASIMSEFMKGISEDDKERMTACREKMASMCSCLKMKEMSEEGKKAMIGKMRSFCGGGMEMMSSFLKAMSSEREQTGNPKNK